MSLKFTTPLTDVQYNNYPIKNIKSIPDENHKDVDLLKQILPESDEIHYYNAPLPYSLKNSDTFEEGIAIVRDGQIIVIAKLSEYFDCGMF